MKKKFPVFALLAILTLSAFGQTLDLEEQEEIDHLFFLPNSGNQFANEAQAMVQLYNAARYLIDRNPGPGRIYVYGYAAAAANDIEPVGLSRGRALYVINELQKRGLSGALFAEPVAYGSVDLWGSNTDEEHRSPNRRVRILLDDLILTPALVQPPASVPETSAAVKAEIIPDNDYSTASARAKFPWWIILLSLIITALAALLVYLLSKSRKKPQEISIEETPPPKRDETPVFVPAAVSDAPEKLMVLEEEEIRRYAYNLFERRNGQSGLDAEDWYQAVRELTEQYKAQGYRVTLYWESRT